VNRAKLLSELTAVHQRCESIREANSWYHLLPSTFNSKTFTKESSQGDNHPQCASSALLFLLRLSPRYPMPKLTSKSTSAASMMLRSWMPGSTPTRQRAARRTFLRKTTTEWVGFSSLLLKIAIKTLPGLLPRQCEPGCSCASGLNPGLYCGYCTSPRKAIPGCTRGECLDSVYQCNSSGGCCLYGRRTSCANRQGPCNG